MREGAFDHSISVGDVPAAEPSVRVLVFDDHVLMRIGLDQMLSGIAFVHCVAATGRVDEATRTLRARAADVLVLGSGASEAARAVFAVAEENATSVLVVERDGALEETCLPRASARLRGHDVDADVVANALRSIVGAPHRRSAFRDRGGDPRALLTPRERQILVLLIEGLSNPEIADRLCMSVHGVKKSVALVMAKLRCRNRTETASRALREGWLSITGAELSAAAGALA